MDFHPETVTTRNYRAPEVIMKCKWDEKIDIWALGCVLLELFLGNYYFVIDDSDINANL